MPKFAPITGSIKLPKRKMVFKNDDYTKWRRQRIELLEEILGKDYFPNKTLLEVGAGFGDTAIYFRDTYGTKVTIMEGRQENVDQILKVHPDIEVHCFNNDEVNHICPVLVREFDIVIHWGLLYHLDNWQEDLWHMLSHVKPDGVFCLESEVANGTDPELEYKVREPVSNVDQAVGGVGTRPTDARIEKFLENEGISFKRYDDARLNVGFHHYDWKAEDVPPLPKDSEDNDYVSWHDFRHGYRRFWVCKFGS